MPEYNFLPIDKISCFTDTRIESFGHPLSKLHYDENHKVFVATDGHILIVVPQDICAVSSDDTELNLMEYVNSKFPDYRSEAVIPKHEQDIVLHQLLVDDIINKCSNIERVDYNVRCIHCEGDGSYYKKSGKHAHDCNYCHYGITNVISNIIPNIDTFESDDSKMIYLFQVGDLLFDCNYLYKVAKFCKDNLSKPLNTYYLNIVYLSGYKMLCYLGGVCFLVLGLIGKEATLDSIDKSKIEIIKLV